MYPVDVIRALKMASASGSGATLSNFVKTHGVRGFFAQGVIPEIGRASMMRVSKFFFFPKLCSAFYGKTVKECSAVEKAFAGALSTLPEIVMISPFEVSKVALQLDEANKFQNNTTKFLRHTIKTRGWSSVYSGWAGMQYRQCSWTAVFFSSLLWYRAKAKGLCEKANIPLSVGNLIGGFCAGVSGVFVNCPGDVVRTVVQKRGFADPSRPLHGIGWKSIAEHATVAHEIFVSRGIRGLYAGFGVKCFHLGCSGALMTFFIPVFQNLLQIEYEI